MGFGGPVWHASVSARFALPSLQSEAAMFEEAEHQLAGVGDRTLGEWRERGDKAMHLRRRLTAKEMLYANIKSVCDVRGTPEQITRVDRMRPFLPPSVQGLRVEQYP
jgi:hypothetical protein